MSWRPMVTTDGTYWDGNEFRFATLQEATAHARRRPAARAEQEPRRKGSAPFGDAAGAPRPRCLVRAPGHFFNPGGCIWFQPPTGYK